MKLDRAYHAVISGSHLCPLVTAIMKEIVPLDGQLTAFQPHRNLSSSVPAGASHRNVPHWPGQVVPEGSGSHARQP